MSSSTQGDRANTASDFVVVANRLPVDRVTNPDGTQGFRRSPGGLVTALEPVMAASEGAWVGWHGGVDEELDSFDKDGIHLVPVPLSEDDLELYYEGFSNSTLWPLYHDVIVPPSYHRTWWDRYKKINQRFADAVLRIAAPNATVWVHDYQLQLVPRLLRLARPDLKIGFFLHIPFPAASLFSQLPWRKQILQGLAGADLVGFQRETDASNFLRCLRRFTDYQTKGREATPSLENDLQNICRADAHPISIDYEQIQRLSRDPQIIARAAQIRHELGNPKTIMLGVDRLDYTKGIRHRLKAYGELLADEQLQAGEVCLIQVASPSRENVGTYIELRDQVELMVGQITGQHDTLSHTTLRYLHHSYPLREMISLYLAADVLLVTALRDGMNLVAKEYVAAHQDGRGVLVLSEFTGAADQLTQSVLVNPHDIDGMKVKIMEAVNMDETEQAKRMKRMNHHLKEFDVAGWSDRFLSELAEINSKSAPAKENVARA
ncbi:trehalose-6-phosphate synthase [Glutamicibacter protophormiae]|uniref:alpha,alpha-trehalose-phosphate synthase (UDP-forming) n=1 Tax=Glutamicibacter protophormiae TaxID=37930 RepID=UPI002A82A912|nr:trehalose-6-phosphate synthase [Glutamicibacter protophormiae]WPR65296.1 trehalose-6-phosphate synthase [Glutamicibacter protophormiae]WPR68793.1 trehalose-6-phosphate synthase [Glutamicibacter protophormiae]